MAKTKSKASRRSASRKNPRAKKEKKVSWLAKGYPADVVGDDSERLREGDWLVQDRTSAPSSGCASICRAEWSRIVNSVSVTRC